MEEHETTFVKMFEVLNSTHVDKSPIIPVIMYAVMTRVQRRLFVVVIYI